MKIGIIGSGQVGGTLTRRLTQLGHDVAVANSRSPESLRELAEETGAEPGTVRSVAEDSEVVILAVPMKAVPELPADAFGSKIVIDATNYYPQRDGIIPDVADRSVTSSRWVADMLPGARVVKAFNTIVAPRLMDLGRPVGDERRVALPVAADDPEAKRVVMDLVNELGFDPVDAGNLDQSWRQQPDTPVFATDYDAEGVRAGLASARP